MNDKHQDPFLDKAKQALDQSADNLPQETLAQLNQIRREALNETLNESSAKPRSTAWIWWAPGGGLMAAMLVAAVVLTTPATDPGATPDPVLQAAADDMPGDMELLTSEEDLVLMEDIEFVAWLMEQENAG